MKNAWLSSIVLMVITLSAIDVFGQVVITYEKESKHKRISLVYSSGTYYPYYYYYPPVRTSPGIIYRRGNWTFTARTSFLSDPAFGYYPSTLVYYPLTSYARRYTLPVYTPGHSQGVSSFTSRSESAKEVETPVSDRIHLDQKLEKGRAAFQSGDYRKAEALWKEVLIQSPAASATAKALYGLALFAQGDYHYGDKALMDAMESGPVAEVLGGIQTAALFRDPQEFERVLGKYHLTKNPDGRLWNVVLMHSSGRTQEAVRALEQLLKESPSDRVLSDLLNVLKK